MRAWLTFIGLVAGLALHGAEARPLHKLGRAELAARLQGDLLAAQIHRQGLRSVIRFVESRTNLFP